MSSPIPSFLTLSDFAIEVKLTSRDGRAWVHFGVIPRVDETNSAGVSSAPTAVRLGRHGLQTRCEPHFGSIPIRYAGAARRWGHLARDRGGVPLCPWIETVDASRGAPGAHDHGRRSDRGARGHRHQRLECRVLDLGLGRTRPTGLSHRACPGRPVTRPSPPALELTKPAVTAVPPQREPKPLEKT